MLLKLDGTWPSSIVIRLPLAESSTVQPPSGRVPRGSNLLDRSVFRHARCDGDARERRFAFAVLEV